MLGVVFMIAVWVKDNIPDRFDAAWLQAGGGFFGGPHPQAGRFNAGQKLIFWSVVLGGIALSVTGIIMLFPFSVADINGMQWAQYIHAIVGVILIADHDRPYLHRLARHGGRLRRHGLRRGRPRLGAPHHRAWVDEQQAKTASGPQVGGGRAPAPAE